MPPIDFAGIFRAIGIRGAIAIGLGLALVFTMWRADAISESRDKLRVEYAGEIARHDVTRQSLTTLEEQFAGFVRAGELRAERLDTALSQVHEETAALRAEAERIEREGVGDDYVQKLQEAGL